MTTRRSRVIVGGHSAINTFLLSLVELQKENPSAKLVWIMRKNFVEEVYGGEEKDALKVCGALGIRIHELVDAGKIEVLKPFYMATGFEQVL